MTASVKTWTISW